MEQWLPAHQHGFCHPGAVEQELLQTLMEGQFLKISPKKIQVGDIVVVVVVVVVVGCCCCCWLLLLLLVVAVAVVVVVVEFFGFFL